MRSLTISKSITERTDMSLGYFLRDISKIPLLDTNQEVKIALKAKNGDKQAINKLVESNLRFVVSVAKQYQGKGLPLVDLIQSGIFGLREAATKYDVTKGFKFISYAVWWIRQSIILALSNESRTVRIPTNQISHNSKITKATEKFEQEHERQPSFDELAESTNLTLEKINSAINVTNRAISFDAPFKDDEVGSLYDVIPNGNASSVDSELENESTYKEIEECLSELSNREGDIVRMSFGIGMDSMTYEEIGERFGIGEERVRQIKHQALDKLKRFYGDRLKELC